MSARRAFVTKQALCLGHAEGSAKLRNMCRESVATIARCWSPIRRPLMSSPSSESRRIPYDQDDPKLARLVEELKRARGRGLCL